MGFISYHGKKEDRYSEILEYSKAIQNEEWAKSEEERISNWLKKLTGDEQLAHLNIPELLKLIIIQYRLLTDSYKAVINKREIPFNCDLDCLWNDFSIYMADRQIRSFHVTRDIREKHLQIFINKIFKVSGTVSASEYIEKMTNNISYCKYFTENFDVTCDGRHFFHLLQYISNEDDNSVANFLEIYKKFAIILNLYFYQAFRPKDNGWIRQIEADRYAVTFLKEQYSKHTHFVLNPAFLQNPIYGVNKLETNTTSAVEIKPSVPDNGKENNVYVPLLYDQNLSSSDDAISASLTKDKWKEIKKLLFDEDTIRIADILKEKGIIAPEEVGYELTGDCNEVIAEIELAWIAKKIGYMTKEQLPDESKAVKENWRICSTVEELITVFNEE